ncbi:MAG: hypothetical protein DRP15_00155 [Candidatus Aenigmatarchaeota archaeon]|nr:MAG: hypothetical protein DRP15_00155 [Candidatus Aenigmarchaeota archaeon]
MVKNLPLQEFATRFFGPIVENYLDYFDTLKINLKRGDIKIPLKEYLSVIFLYSLLAFIFTMIGASVFITLLIVSLSGAGTIYSYTSAIILSFLCAGGVFAAGYYYPTIRAKSLQSKIERSLPFAVFYMATTASSGVNPVEIFKMLSLKGGPIGREAGKIYSDVKTLGMSLPSAVQKAALRSPSPMFSDFLWGILSVITTGGDLEKYLIGKTRTFMDNYRRALDEYAKQIALYTEIYITLIIVGTLFFIVLISIISPVAGANTLILQTFLVFFFVPLVSLGFIVLLKGISPTEYD